MLYSILKDKDQKAYRLKSNDDILLGSIASMFTIKNIPKTIDTAFLQIVKLIRGYSAMAKITDNNNKEKWVSAWVDFAGEPDEYGIGVDAIVSTQNGITKEFTNWRENKDIIVVFNTSIKMPDMNIGKFSDMLTEVETSLHLNVLFSRFYPIPVAHDTSTQKAINQAISNMINGVIKDGCTIFSDDIIAQFSEGGNGGIDLVNLTDVQKSQNIQYLSKYRDDIFRWFYSLYGMNSQGSSKMAQQTVDEVNQDNNASMIIPHDMFKCFKDAIEEAKEKQPEVFGDAEVSFTECWMSRLANMDDEFKETDEELEETDETDEVEETDVKDGDSDENKGN